MPDYLRLLFCLGAVFLALFLVFSLPFFQVPPAVTIAVYVGVVLFGLTIYLSFTAGKKLASYILAVRYHELSANERKRIWKLACLRMLPIWLCYIIVSVIPFVQWEVWLMLCMPCVVVAFIAAKSVFHDYYMLTGERWRYWSLQIGVFIAVQVVCQSIVRTLL